MTRSASRARVSDDYGAMISELYARVYGVEQLTLSPAVMGADNTFSEIIIDNGFDDPVFINLSADPPTSLTLATDTFYNEIFINADWDPPTDISNIAGYNVELAKRITTGPDTYDFPTSTTIPGSNYRFRALEPNTHYRVRVWSVNNLGLRSSTFLEGFVDTLADQTVPPAVTGVSVSRGATSAVVYFTPLTAAQAPDVANGNGVYLIELHNNSSFTSLIRVTRTTAQVVSFSDIGVSGTEGNVWARVAPIDQSGNQGPWANSAAAVVGGLVESMIFGTITGAKITVGTLDGDRIIANSIDVAKLKANSILAQNINIGSGGQFTIGTAGSTGLLLNSQGLSLYAGSTRTVYLDALTGSAAFTGTVSASTIVGSNITGGTITGTTFQTAQFVAGVPSARIVMSTTLTGSGAGAYASIDLHSARIGDDYQSSGIYAYQVTDPTVGLFHQLTFACGRLINDANPPAIFLTSRSHSGSSVALSQGIIEAEFCRIGYAGPRHLEIGVNGSTMYGNTNCLVQATSSAVTMEADPDSLLQITASNYLFMSNQDNQYMEMGTSYMQWKHLTGSRVYLGNTYAELLADGDSYIAAGSNYALLKADADTYVQVTASNDVTLQAHSNSWIDISAGDTLCNVNGGNYFQVQSGGSVLIRGRRSGGYGDIQLQGLFNSSTDPLVRINLTSWQVFYDSSSEKYKEEIRGLDEVYDIGELIDNMSPIAYRERDFAGDLKPHALVGLSAEKLHQIAPQLVCLNDQGEPNSILYDKLSVVAVAGVKDLRKRVVELEGLVRELLARN